MGRNPGVLYNGEKMMNLSFYRNKSVLITGHTGFKGSWMCKFLIHAGAKVTGYALNAPTNPNLFELCQLEKQMNSVMGDIRDLKHLRQVFEEVQPEIVIHMAAQPIVRDSYKEPVYTYEVNVMGTVNVLECIRKCTSVKSFVNVTTDKVYLNKEWVWGYREGEELNGYDPYSNSKSCSELVTSSYQRSFFQDRDVAISTARAGNVIGGGDFAKDRIIPDCIRAACEEREIAVRNPASIRPYQHVLEPIAAYLLIAQMQYENRELAGSYNIGPNESDCWETGKIAALFCEIWNHEMNTNIKWKSMFNEGPHEAKFLKLDCAKAKSVLGWRPRWNVETAMGKIVEWTKEYLAGEDISKCMDRQIEQFLDEGMSGEGLSERNVGL